MMAKSYTQPLIQLLSLRSFFLSFLSLVYLDLPAQNDWISASMPTLFGSRVGLCFGGAVSGFDS